MSSNSEAILIQQTVQAHPDTPKWSRKVSYSCVAGQAISQRRETAATIAYLGIAELAAASEVSQIRCKRH
jgi:hypothetical protein